MLLVRMIKKMRYVFNEMEISMDIQIGDVITLKKQHPCGSKEWEVLREGADFRLKCCGCGHQIMIARRVLEKSVKEVKAV